MKKFLIAIAIITILAIAYYFLSPIFITIEADEASPLTTVKDNLDTMDPETKAEFDKQVDDMKDKVMDMADTMPAAPELLAEGKFQPRAHEVAGKALLIESNGKKTLRFEDFETVNGPDLRIYLSTDASDDDFIELGKITATKGNVNYEVPDSVDTEKYNHVLVWCKPFGVLFSYAQLT